MTRTPTKARSTPAQEQARRLDLAFDLLNRALFNGQLPPTMLRLERCKNSNGYFAPNKFADANGGTLDCITLNSTNAATRPLIELLSTLAHEMCHQYVYRVINEGKATGGHGPDWRREMGRIGLPPIRVGRTWQQATHAIDPSGLYACCFDANSEKLQDLPWQELARDATRGRAVGLDKVRFQCPSCSQKVWGRAAAEVLCGTCTTASPLRLVWMVPEYRAEGGGGKGSSQRATASRTDYAEPSVTPHLPVWTDEAGRELRLHTGLDYPPKDRTDALLVLTFGVQERKPELLPPLTSALEQKNWDAMDVALKAIYRHRCQVLHPDVQGGSELAFKALQTAYLMLKREKRGGAHA